MENNEVDLRVWNGEKVVALSMEIYVLTLHSDLLNQLENCYYLPAINKNIIYVSCLENFDFSFIITKKCLLYLFKWYIIC